MAFPGTTVAGGRSTTRLEDALRRAAPRGRVLTAPAQLVGYAADGISFKRYRPDAVVIPADAGEMVEIFRQARHWNVPICVRGAGTSLAGGPVAAQGGVVVHTSALRGIREIDRAGGWCEVECSVTLRQIEQAVEPLGLFYPPDPSSGTVSTIGGNVAMNAGGAHCFRYGVTSNYVLGVEALLMDGSVHRFGGPAGGRGPWREDWKRLMVGSEGTLAAFTRFWLRLVPRPEKVWTFRATYRDLVDAERAIHALVADSAAPVAIELMDPRCVALVENSQMAVGLPQDCFLLIVEIDGPATLVDARVAGVTDLLHRAGAVGVEASDEAEERRKLWKARKAAGGLFGQVSPDFVVQDAVIPKRALADVLQHLYDESDAVGISVVNVFHAGDGNLHPNFLFDAARPGDLEKVERLGKQFMHRVIAVGGTLSGEHGIGNDKAAYMPLVLSPDNIGMQLAVPAAFNPRDQLNPLKVFTSRRFDAAAASRGDIHAVIVGPASPATAGRAFTPFVDPVDGVACVPADATAADIDAVAAPHRLRFPLVLDPGRPLVEQIAASGHASASSRFGPYCDAILGVNWRLGDGRVVRVGERVVKTTTGYDLLRFLLSSGGRFGTPVDCVLRLRPAGELSANCQVTGAADAVVAAASGLARSCWVHWFDAIDLIVAGDRVAARIGIQARAAEWPVYEAFLAAWAREAGVTIDIEQGRPAASDGLPDAVLETTSDRAAGLARGVGARPGVRAVAILARGVVHVHASPAADAAAVAADVVARHAGDLEPLGGSAFSRHLPPRPAAAAEAAWIDVLARDWGAA
jgi:glycolate oxidase subunit GlcD